MVGSTYTILNNTGTAGISGTFNGQAQSSIIQISGTPFQISYTGGHQHELGCFDRAGK